jgi:hypothetical protein
MAAKCRADVAADVGAFQRLSRGRSGATCDVQKHELIRRFCRQNLARDVINFLVFTFAFERVWGLN